MATFRSRQRANQRRDVKREPRSARPEEGKAPVDPATARTRPQNETRRPSDPNAARRDAPAPRPGEVRKDRSPQSDFKRAPRVEGSNVPPRGTDARKDRAPQSEFKREPRAPRTEGGSFPPRGADARKDRAPQSEFKREPRSEAANAPSHPAPEPTPPAAPQPTTPRRRLITPASEAPPPRPRAPEAEAPSAQPAVEPAPPKAAEVAEAPVAPAPSTPRRRLITPASEAPPPRPRTEEPASIAAPRENLTPDTQEEAPRARTTRPARPLEPNRHAPDPRRGLPTNEAIMPSERPAFERRTAEKRRRDEPRAALAFFASCPRGLEPVLVQELQRMAADDVESVDGGASFTGTMDMLMRVNLESRVASRVLLRLAHGPYGNERDVNALAMQIDWPSHFDVTRTIKVKTDGVGARVKSLDFVSLTVKDAICDRFRQAQLGRPNVDTRTPDARIQVFLSPDTATIYLDSSGEALFKRGWRRETGDAPLKENLAAGILLLAGYNGEQPLIDPMCGSGTFLVEAAEIALNRAPGRAREFAFQKWTDFDQASWDALKSAAKNAEKNPDALLIQGSDCDPKMVAIARANLERADLAHLITPQTMDMFDVRPNAETGLIVTNPPYGVRMEEQETLAELYPKIGDWLKQYFAGWTANLFSGDMALPKLIRLSVKRRIPLYNGSLGCRIFVLRLIAGSAREEKL